MEAWGTGHLQNDVASDWVYAFFDPGDHLALIQRAIEAVAALPAGTPVDTDAAAVALAAGEVIAAWRGQPGPDVNDTVTVWARAQKAPPTAELCAAASAVAERVGAASGLRDHWAGGDDLDAWCAAVDQLRERLGG